MKNKLVFMLYFFMFVVDHQMTSMTETEDGKTLEEFLAAKSNRRFKNAKKSKQIKRRTNKKNQFIDSQVKEIANLKNIESFFCIKSGILDLKNKNLDSLVGIEALKDKLNVRILLLDNNKIKNINIKELLNVFQELKKISAKNNHLEKVILPSHFPDQSQISKQIKEASYFNIVLDKKFKLEIEEGNQNCKIEIPSDMSLDVILASKFKFAEKDHLTWDKAKFNMLKARKIFWALYKWFHLKVGLPILYISILGLSSSEVIQYLFPLESLEPFLKKDFILLLLIGTFLSVEEAFFLLSALAVVVNVYFF